MRRVREVIAASLVLAASGACLTGPVSSASAASPPLPSVVTVDSSYNVWLSSAGNAPTKLRDGQVGVYPGVASEDGTTSMWIVGEVLHEALFSYHGQVLTSVRDTSGSFDIKYDVAATAPIIAGAVPSLKFPGQWDVSVLDGTTNGLPVDTRTYNSPILDIWLSADGSTLYLLLGGSAWSVWTCSTHTLVSCGRVGWVDVAGAKNAASRPVWDHVSADGLSVAGVVDTGASPARYQAWHLTPSVTTQPHATDGGTVSTKSIGRFVGNDLWVAEPGHLLGFQGVPFTISSPSSDTAMAMTGSPDFINAPGSAFDGTLAARPAVMTTTSLLRQVNGTFVTQPSQALAITTTMNLYPGTSAPLWPYLYWNPSVSHVKYSYDKLTWTDWPWSTSVFQIHQNVWLVATHDDEINATASESAPILISARPVVTAGYKPATRTMYGAATVPDGTKVYVQRRISTNTWSTYATPLAKSKAYSVKLPAAHGQWRAVVLATSTYVQSISTTVVT
jgi:hypothetical protein